MTRVRRGLVSRLQAHGVYCVVFRIVYLRYSDPPDRTIFPIKKSFSWLQCIIRKHVYIYVENERKQYNRPIPCSEHRTLSTAGFDPVIVIIAVAHSLLSLLGTDPRIAKSNSIYIYILCTMYLPAYIRIYIRRIFIRLRLTALTDIRLRVLTKTLNYLLCWPMLFQLANCTQGGPFGRAWKSSFQHYCI